MARLFVETSAGGASFLLETDYLLRLDFPRSSTLGCAFGTLLERFRRATGIRPGDIEEIYCGVGPGSYTGVRCGLAFSKALAMATGARLFGVPSLLGMALEAKEAHGLEGLIVATANAYQGEVYARFVVAEEGSVKAAGEDLVLPLEKFPAAVESSRRGLPVTVIGFAGGKTAGTWRTLEGSPGARGVYLASRLLGRQALPEGIEQVQPAYLKESAAERKKREKRG